MNEWNFILKTLILYVSTQKSKNLIKYVQNIKEKKKETLLNEIEEVSKWEIFHIAFEELEYGRLILNVNIQENFVSQKKPEIMNLDVWSGSYEERMSDL